MITKEYFEALYIIEQEYRDGLITFAEYFVELNTLVKKAKEDYLEHLTISIKHKVEEIDKLKN